MDTSTPLRVAVLYGGDSAESEISLASGIAAAAALDEAGHRVRAIDPLETPLSEVDWTDFDVCFIALHGGAGEDGRVQLELESLGIPYTGSRPDACRWAMSKSAAKRRLQERGVPTPQFAVVSAEDSIEAIAGEADALGYPIVVKPDEQGSSLGVGVVWQRRELQAVVLQAGCFGGRLILESYIAGREFTVALIDRLPLPLMEVISPYDVFNYDAKYHNAATETVFDCGLDAATIDAIEHAAIETAEALETSGLVRVDLRLDEQDRPWVLELNTSPGLTDRSLAPLAAAHAGIPLPELCDRLVRSCMMTEAAA